MFQLFVDLDLSYEGLTDFSTSKTCFDYFFNCYLNAANMPGQLYLPVRTLSKRTGFESQLIQLNACKTAFVSSGLGWNQFADFQEGRIIF